MATEHSLPFNVAAVVEAVLQQQGPRLTDVGLASRKADEASLRRYDAAGWLRKTVGVVGGKDLPAEPSEEDFRLGLRSGIILCNVINKVQPGAVAKVVEGPCDSAAIPDGAALSAFQYFENVRNFLVAVEELGLPTFEASDLEQGGKSASARIVNCVLALKSYYDWKQAGGSGSWKFVGNLKPPISGKPFLRKNSEPFMSSFTRTSSWGERSQDSFSSEDFNEAGSSQSLHLLVREILSDKKQEEIPFIVESMLSKVMEEFQHRLASQTEQVRATSKDSPSPGFDSLSLTDTGSGNIKNEEKDVTQIQRDDSCDQTYDNQEGSKGHLVKHKMLVEQQKKNIQELKHTLYDTKAGMKFLQMKYQEEFHNLGMHLHGLAHAASGYQKVLEENRKLYNLVQDLKGNIRVYCRVRPPFPGQTNRSNTFDHIDDGKITIVTPSKYGKEGRKSFTFNKVFGPFSTQEEVFSDTQPLIRSVLDGYNVCIFAYGQTGSGKTYTMTGPSEITEESQGVNYRALSDLFHLSELRKDTVHYEISVQMLEIYNEQVRDLLAVDGSNQRLEIRNSSQNGINVPEANLVPVSSTSDVIYLMNLGHKNRAVSSTAMNDRSSRSHSCLTVHVHGKDLTSGSILRGCMHLVDLAGSERVDKSEVTGDRLKEAQHINKSLSALGDVIASLAQKNSHVPYRNSKLTQLLQDSLGGQAKTLMFVHISPEYEALGETLSTLKFAERVSTVELGAARVNKDGANVKDLKEQIATLKTALARKEGEGMHLKHSLSLSPERFRMKSSCTSPLLPSGKSTGDFSGGRKQSTEDFGNIEVRKTSAPKPKRRSLDIQDMLTHSSPWPIVASPTLNVKEDDEELFSSFPGDWVDKVMVNKLESKSRKQSPLRSCWDHLENRQSPEMLGQSRLPHPSIICSTTKREDTQEFDESDDQLDATTSDSSEPDLLWQLNTPTKPTNITNASGPRTKKTNSRPIRSPETRSFIPSLIPSPSRKPPNGVSQALPKRQSVSSEGKRRYGGAK
ncbi:kinesin-like protein KIN-14I [Argentina anserina]|uniref:kinesin-like protein KIN-14I n=1 Tax=Argentina anserina TaxID=57926 RepID=UPI002176844C|nr:kinesin-like protein KIN-14I [Potentilla anserina]